MKAASSLHIAIELARTYRRTLIVVVPLFFVAGLAEGVGIIALLPVLGIVADSSAAADNALGRWVIDVFARLGIPLSLVPLLVMMVVMVVAKTGLGLLAMRQVGYATANVAADLRRDLLRTLMQARWSYFTRMPVGRLANAMSGEVMRAAAIFNALCQILNQASQAVIYGALALFVSPVITLAAAVLGCFLFATLHGLVVLVSRASGAQTRAMKSLVERLTDGLTSFKAIKAMGREDRLGPILDSLTIDINRAQRRETMSIAALHSVHEPILTVVLAIGLYFALKNLEMPFIELLFIAVLFHRTVTRIGQVQAAYQALVSRAVSYRAVQTTIAEAEEVAEGRGGTARPVLSEGIALEEVAFAHGDNAVLESVTFAVPSGHFVTLTGHSGSGKTTIADLVIGLYMPDRGRVTIDGVATEDVDLSYWRSCIGYVPQEPFLLNDTVLYNVTLGDPKLGPAEAKAALQAAGAWAFVEEAPGGLDYGVGERGSGLSGGQRQRIAIARALVRRPRLLILDEPTTALDPATEAAICATLRQLAGTMTVLAISHQPALVEIADDVIEVRDGYTKPIERLPAPDAGKTRTVVG